MLAAYVCERRRKCVCDDNQHFMNCICHLFFLYVSYSPECLIIEIPPDDPYFPPSFDCMNFVRSIPAISAACMPGKYYTGEDVHPSTIDKQHSLRRNYLQYKIQFLKKGFQAFIYISYEKTG